ncbi:zinc-binding dehydrogenase [Microbacterium caowuchunii]|nr:zinc-binding dehydrogenase [Microbacterium caowuchunii]
MTSQIPHRMRAAVLRGEQPRLEITEIDVPVPRAGEALVRVIACGVCHTDLHVMKGEVAFPRPAVLGHEISGEIVALGEGTAAPEGVGPGDVVVAGFIMPCTECAACRRGRDDLCAPFFAQNRLRGTLYDGESRLRMPDGSFLAMYSMGGLAEYCVVPVSALVPLPAGVDPVAGCILGCAGLTSYGAVVRAGRVERGTTVAVVGVGGVGSGIVQMARAAGADRIVAVDIAQDKLDAARRLGATDVVDASSEDPVTAVRTLIDGGADVVFEALGRPQTFAQAARMLADGGRMVAVGIAPGGATAEVEITPLVRRGYSITGSFGGRTRADLPAVVELAAQGAFDAAEVITRHVSLADVDGAYRALARGEITGRAVVVMDAAADGRA